MLLIAHGLGGVEEAGVWVLQPHPWIQSKADSEITAQKKLVLTSTASNIIASP